MSVVAAIKTSVSQALRELYGTRVDEADLAINRTRPEFTGDYTVVLFALSKPLKRSPEAIGKELGEKLLSSFPVFFSSFNVIKGFLNLGIADAYWIKFLESNFSQPRFGFNPPSGRRVLVEYSSPNTNKPLHLGHLRNNFLGWSVAEILKACGDEVIRTCVVNDRGIHICKSMIAWQLFANGATPQSAGVKGDHFVGDYYVRFNDEYKKQVGGLVEGGMHREQAEKDAPIMKAAQEMLLRWEAGDAEVLALWKKMNGWVYEGFDATYRRIGSEFDKVYYESDTYLMGKDLVQEGLRTGAFYQKPDGSVWADLTGGGLDEKLVLRSDGTAVYITQDLGLAEQRYEEYRYDQTIYVIGDEQNYHMKALQLMLKKMGKPYSEGIYHLSYGMVELPTGRMKSREGTVVDADDLIEEMVAIAARHTEELGKVKDFTEAELKELHDIIGLGALKFFLLRVDPKKRMVFNPEESVDFHGFTGPFVQYSHARIRSILRKESPAAGPGRWTEPLLPLEKELLLLLEQYPVIIRQACEEHNPSVLAIHIFQLARTFNTFYTGHSVLNAESEEKKQLRLRLSEMTANVIRSGMSLLGIRVPERM